MPPRKLSEADLAAVKEEMRAIMIEVARQESTITYSELSLRLQTAYIHYHSFIMARLLDEIGHEEIEAGRGVLPAVVVRKGLGIPGGGYFGHTSPNRADDADFETRWRADLDALYAYWRDH